jgi:hypothetical protein
MFANRHHTNGNCRASACLSDGPVGANPICGGLKADASITLGANSVYGSIISAATVNYGSGARQAGKAAPLPADFGGETFEPGTYKRTAATGPTGIITLDSSSVVFNTIATAGYLWTFEIDGAFTTTAGSQMVFSSIPAGVTQAQLAKLVLWDVTGAITLGAGSTAAGQMLATGAITVGATATCDDLSSSAAVTLGAGSEALSTVSTGCHRHNGCRRLRCWFPSC